MSARFTIDGSDALEHQLEDLCAEARDGVLAIIPGRALIALVLGGGYGRGEGGVLTTPSGEQPYNDLEFYILLDGSDLLARRRFGKSIHDLAERLSNSASVEIEFKILSIGKLRRSDVTMFYYDLVNGHRLIHGAEDWLAGCDCQRASHRIPLHEATRLLMNRCSGLLFAQERLGRPNFSSAESDFVGRNLAKAKLAFGDVLLAMRGLYHWSCCERNKRLRKLAAELGSGDLSSLLLLHEQGVDFKLHPVRTSRPPADLSAELAYLKEIGRDLWLQLESRRLGQSYDSIFSYCADPSSKCPETNPWKNRLVNARTFGPPALMDSRYPRERLLRSLPLLLWHSDYPELLALVQRQLRTSARSFSELVAAYENLWRIYN